MPLNAQSYVCDTIPAPRFASNPSSKPILLPDFRMEDPKPELPTGPPPPPPSRKLCVRHQRMADEGTNLKLQQSIDALPLQEREAINAIWSNFSSSSHPRRALILQGILTMCCFSQLSLLSEQLAHLIRLDPFTVLPREVCLKVLGNLDATSLCRAAQVSKRWRVLADDDILWRSICEQHIGQKCLKCGWGLPVLEKRRPSRVQSSSPPPCLGLPSRKRLHETKSPLDRPIKRQRSEPASPPFIGVDHLPDDHSIPSGSTSYFSDSIDSNAVAYRSALSVTRPWKDVYSERLSIERNWRRGRCTVRTLKGHTDGVMCLQFSESLSYPSYPILITGSYDRTIRVWNLETGAELRCLKGHTRAVRALQFDEVTLITGSMDHTIRVWDWRKGRCIRTLTGHTEGVVCLKYDSNVLASGSADTTIKVWNLRTQEAFTLRGHTDWVNAVQLWDSNSGNDASASPEIPTLDPLSSSASPSSHASPQIDPGKMLFSASDDGTIRLWDLTLRSCVRQFVGHVAQVQSLRLLPLNGYDEERRDPSGKNEGDPATSSPESGFHYQPLTADIENEDRRQSISPIPSKNRCNRVLISGSLDNTIKMWDVDTGETLQTFFGHIEGVWVVASDKLRLVSGSHDRTIKVWVREEGRCIATLVGHRGAVTCLALGEDKIVSGSDDGDVKIWSFGG